MDKDNKEIQTLLQQIRDESSDTEYIYRGETKKFTKISSTLYRKHKDEKNPNELNINTAQKDVLKNVKEYISFDKEIDTLIELQHYGGKTNLIDFSTDYLIALFFACDAEYNKDGRLILLKKNTPLGSITIPPSKNVRIISQKSIFFEPPKGFIEKEKVKEVKKVKEVEEVKEVEKVKEVEEVKEVEKVKTITIKQKLKQPILSYLKQYHRITTESIYNDLLGYIQNQDKHKDADTQFYIGLTCQDKAKEYQQAGKDVEAQKEYNKAIPAYTAAIKLRPDNAAAYNNRGLAQIDLGRYQKAITDYTTAIELNPDHAKAYYHRGLAKAKLGQYQQARADYTEAMNLAKKQDNQAFIDIINQALINLRNKE